MFKRLPLAGPDQPATYTLVPVRPTVSLLEPNLGNVNRIASSEATRHSGNSFLYAPNPARYAWSGGCLRA
jgi:hypothetical protein